MSGPVLPGLGAPNPLNLGAERRAAFAGMFPTFRAVMEGYCRCAGLGKPGLQKADHDRAMKLMHTEPGGWPNNGVEVMSALFAVKVLSYRAKIEKRARQKLGISKPSAIEDFVAAATLRFSELSITKFDELEIIGSETATRSWIAYTQLVMSQILDSIEAEAEADVKDWDEADFLRTIFLGLADSDGSGYVVRGFQAVFLNHVGEFKMAVAEDTARGNRAGFTVHEGGKTQ